MIRRNILLLLKFQIQVIISRDVAQEELNAADKEKITGIAALTFTCSVTVVFYLFVKNALSAIKVEFASY